MNKLTQIIFGILVILLGVAMLLFGVSMFTYQGPPISEIKSEAGKYAFFLWLPTLLAGLCILIIGLFKKE